MGLRLDAGQGHPGRGEVPCHLRRYVANRNDVPEGHFSILVELTQSLIAPMELDGYTLPDYQARPSRRPFC